MPRADVHGAYYCMGVFRTLTESYQPFLFWTARSTLLYFLTLFRSSGGPQSDSDGCPPGTTKTSHSFGRGAPCEATTAPQEERRSMKSVIE